MKTIKLLILTVLIAGLSIPEAADAQSWGGRRKPGFWDQWSINGNAGLTSFFGDLSIYDTDIVSKLSKESGPALGAILTKHINDKFGISGQLMYGSLKGENTAGTSFESTFIEYNFHVRMQLINLIWPDNYSGFDVNVYGGLGQFVFNTTQWAQVEGETQESIENTGTPEFVYFVGLGLQYDITHKLGVTMDMSLRQAQNDKIDDMAKNGNMDYYTLINIGITYHIESFKKSKGFSRGGSTRGRMPGRLPMRRRR